MSIALERNNSNSIQRSNYMQCLSTYDTSDTKVFDGDRRFPAGRDREEEDGDSSSSSSIGRNSDCSGGSSDSEDSNEVQSSYKGPLDTLDALEQVLPIKRGISNFYSGKSKSFTSLADVSCTPSVKELAKPDNAYTRKRKNLLAHGTFWDKKNHPVKSNGSGISKRTPNSGRSTSDLVAMGSSESNTSECSNSISSSPSSHLPPLHSQGKKLPANGSSSAPPQRNSPWRSFSLSDLQCVAAATPSITSLAIHGGDMDNKQY